MKANVISLWLLCLVYVCSAQMEFDDYVGVYQKNEVEEILDFLKRGERLLQIDSNYEDIILLTGNTGTGKSTLGRFVAGNLSDLESIGEGPYRIKYKDEGIIGNSTTVSQTIYPERIIDETDVAFYDCPGYDDTRNSSIEISTTYLMKKVVDNAKTLKIILVANYDSVLQGGSRGDFVTLIEHTRRFLKNLTSYENSIALIATKVNNVYVKVNKNLVLRSDEEMIKGIVAFLSEYLDRLKSETESDFNKYARTLVQILLKSADDGKTYEKIGIFRQPDEAGPLDQIELMVEGREKARDLIINRITYGVKNASEIGYTISEASRLKLIEFATGFNSEITKKVQEVGREIEEHFGDEEKRLGNLVALANRYQNAYYSISNITENVNLNGPQYINHLIDTVSELSVPVSPEYFAKISSYLQHITFLQEFTIDRLPISTNDWSTGLRRCKDYLEETKNWFKFLSEIYDQYSQYDFRSEITKYNVSDINDWGMNGRPQGIYIGDDRTFRIFAEKQKSPELVRNVKMTAFRLEVLNNLLDITLKQTPVSTCEADNTKLVVKGDFVRMMDVNKKLCGDKLKTLHIFALNTVFIDNDLHASGNKINVTIIAPKWYISGDNRKFNLSGLDNGDLYESAAEKSIRANKTGNPGLAGKAGGNSGNFIGLGLHFIQGSKLEIFANGGKGSAGQSGGSGFNSSTNPDHTGIGTGTENGTEIYSKKYRLIEVGEYDYKRTTSGRIVYDTYKTYYTIHSECSTAAGDGGKGGFGGRFGSINIIELGGKSLVKQIAQTGPEGMDGKKGNITANPQKVKLLYTCQKQRGRFVMTTAAWTKISVHDDDTCPSNGNAEDGGNSENREEAQPTYLNEIAYPLNEFKAFVRENQRNNLKRDDLIGFVNLIDNNTGILANYSTKGFVDELQTLESQFYQLQHDIDLAMHYLSLAQRIEKFVNFTSAASPEDIKEQIKVFNYLYTASWSKYLSLHSHDALMVIDVDKYLTTVTESIRKFKASARQTIIDDKRKEYRKNIEIKINEANRLIDNNILPEIKNISSSIDNSLHALVNATIDKQKEAEKDLNKYREQQKKLGSQIGLRILFSTLGSISQFSSMLGPYGMAVSGIGGGVSQIALGFLDKTDKAPYLKIPEGVRTSLDAIDSAMKNRREERMKVVEEELKKYKKEAEEVKPLDDVVKKITELEKALKETAMSSTQADEKEKELSELVAEKRKLLEKDNLTDEEKKAKKIVKRLGTGLTVLSKSFEIFKMFVDGLDELEEIDKSVSDSADILDALYEYERKIYNEMWPMVDEMRNKISDPKEHLSGESGSVLDLKKWQIQSMIRNTRIKIQKFAKGFTEQEEELNQVLQKLDEAFEILINVYDRIETYYDQEKLGDFIATVVSADFAKIVVTDQELQSALLRLDLYISANVVLNQYKSAVDAFEQAIFPFASMYLDQNRLPANLQLGNNTANLVEKAVENLERLQANINEYDKGVINKNDKYIVSAQFNGNLSPPRPFYEWKSEVLGLSVTELFAGKEILLRADIKKGLQWNAIKFNVVELLFKSMHQQELDAELSNFNIHLTHTGNSYYRCGGSFFVIDRESPELVYSYQKENDVPVDQNMVYQKIKSGTIMLSPYTMWSVRLERIIDDPKAFSRLSSLADNIDLVLTGRGLYVRNDVPVCDNTMKKYYEAEPSISEMSIQRYYY